MLTTLETVALDAPVGTCLPAVARKHVPTHQKKL
jgi:hypothetical protein